MIECTEGVPMTDVAPLPRRRRRALLLAAIALVAAIVVGIVMYVTHWPFGESSPQIVFASTGSANISGLAVDRSGTVYAADASHNRIETLPRGAERQRTWDLGGDGKFAGLAVRNDGTMFVADYLKGQLFEWRPASPRPAPLLRPGAEDTLNGVAVDARGDVFYTAGYGHRVMAIAPGSGSSLTLPFDGLKDAMGVAVDQVGNVFVADSGNNRVLKLAPHTRGPQVLPFTGLEQPWGIAVDATGNVYVSDRRHNRVLKLAPGSETPQTLPFSHLNYPSYLAVDTTGNLYVNDWYNNRVLELPAQ
jgi:serine/threonine protein kinase, bacterial